MANSTWPENSLSEIPPSSSHSRYNLSSFWQVRLGWRSAFQPGPFHLGLIEVCAQWDFLAFAGGVPAVVVVVRRPDLAVLALFDTADHAWQQVAVGCGSLAHGSAHIREVE